MFLPGGNKANTSEVKNSLRINAAASSYLSRTFPAGTRTKFTYSTWIKRGALGAGQVKLLTTGYETSTPTSGYFIISSDGLVIESWDAGTKNVGLSSTALYRDPSAFLHIVVTVDTTQAVASDRVKAWVNNSLVAFTAPTYPALNYSFQLNTNEEHLIGAIRVNGAVAQFADNLMARTCFVDGQALTPSAFAYTDTSTDQWVSKSQSSCKVVVSAGGATSFLLDFDDGASTVTLGADRSGKGNNWTLNNFVRAAGVTDCWLTDTPSNNYPTLSAVDNGAQLSGASLALASSGAAWQGARCTQAVPLGKYYWECHPGAGSYTQMSLATAAATLGTGHTATGNYTWDRSAGNISYGSSVQTTITLTATDVVGIAVDGVAGTVAFYKNGALAYTFAQTFSGAMFPAMWNYQTSPGYINFGQRPFAYTPPTGFKALCTKNLPVPSIKLPKKHFDVLTYTGNGATNVLTGLQFPPDFAWQKSRGPAYSHGLYDVIRGVSKKLSSNGTGAEVTTSGLTSFDAGGITLGSDAGENQSPSAFVSWLWKAGGAPVANNNGSIASQVSANVAAGFSIVTYTGTGAAGTVGHGLGVAPALIIYKARGAAGSWVTGHKLLNGGVSPWNYTMFLELTNAQAATPNAFNNTAPTSSQFSVGPTYSANGISQVAYCAAEVPGFSKIGSYTGNGSADGPFVWCGFRPRFLMVKRTDTASDWVTLDTARDSFNAAQSFLYPNLSSAEAATTIADFVAIGFKVRGTHGSFNVSGGSYIFWAIAEAPFNYANAR